MGIKKWLRCTSVSRLVRAVERLQKVAQTAFSPPTSERNGLAKRAPKARASPIHFASGFDAPSPASRCSNWFGMLESPTFGNSTRTHHFVEFVIERKAKLDPKSMSQKVWEVFCRMFL